jgi:hypothetical protein
MIRVPGVKTTILAALFFFVSATAIIANFGFALASVAQDPTAPANAIARDLISQLSDGRIEGIASLTLVTVLSVAIFGPFTGTGTASLAPAEDLMGLRPARAHKYFDSLVINGVSGLGIIQLLGLVGLNSFLTLDGPRGSGLLLAFTSWALLISLMTAMAWVIEWVVRRFGRWQRYVIAAAVIGIASAVYLSNPNQASTLFGLGEWYVSLLRDGNATTFVVAIASALAITVSLTSLGLKIFLSTDKHLPSAPLASRTSRYREFSSYPLLIAVRVVVTTLFRTPQTRRPMVAALVFGAPAVMAINIDQLLAGSISFAIPLAIALSWPANVYAVVGTGMPWLASQPRVMAVLPKAVMLTQFILTMGIISILGFLATVSGRASIFQVQEILTQSAFITICVTGVSGLLAILNPIRAQMSNRGDTLVPPVTALVYMVAFLVFTAFPGSTFSGTLKQWPWVEVASISLAGIVGIGFGLFALSRWKSDEVRSRVVATVGAE